jgi:TonB family protein
MATLLAITSVAMVSQLFSWTQEPRPPGPGRLRIASEGRFFAVGSNEAWALVQERLGSLGFSFDKIDRTNHVILTKWRGADAKGLEWLPAASLPEPYVAERFRFEVFVSPFAQPARVYVGSLVEARKAGPGSASATAYNVRNLNQALMGEIAKAVGQDGFPIPTPQDERRRLALSLLREGADACSKQESPPPGAKITPPQKIRDSEFPVLYPPAALSEGVEGSVQVEFTVLEDGSVRDPRLVGSPLGHQLEASALGAASLLLYRPTKLGECSVPTVVTYTVHYRLR